MMWCAFVAMWYMYYRMVCFCRYCDYDVVCFVTVFVIVVYGMYITTRTFYVVCFCHYFVCFYHYVV